MRIKGFLQQNNKYVHHIVFYILRVVIVIILAICIGRLKLTPYISSNYYIAFKLYIYRLVCLCRLKAFNQPKINLHKEKLLPWFTINFKYLYTG